MRADHETYPFPAPDHVQQICSVSSCIAKRIESFEHQEISERSFNQYGGFNSPKDAREVILQKAPIAYELFAYAVPETHYQDGHAIPYEIGCVDPEIHESEESHYTKIGYDIVEIRNCAFFCSPLSCNHQARRTPERINHYGLTDLESDAIWLAEKFSTEKPEPGPYLIVEIWRHEP